MLLSPELDEPWLIEDEDNVIVESVILHDSSEDSGKLSVIFKSDGDHSCLIINLRHIHDFLDTLPFFIVFNILRL